MTARGLDHLVVAVRDLDGAARFYERLGFQLGARNRHPWGTENRLVQFAGSFIELITVGRGAKVPPHGPRFFSFGAFVRDYLARREGLAMLVLNSDDAVGDAAAFAAAGIGDFEPLHFERRGRRPDGSEIELAFTLAFASDLRAPEASFFTSQQHRPENFWNAAFQKHRNGATALAAAVLATDAPGAHQRFLEAFTGARAEHAHERDLSVRLARGRIDAVTPDDAAELYGSVEAEPHHPSFVAFAVSTPDIRDAGRVLDDGGIPYQAIGSRLVVPASVALGVAIAFEPA